MRNCRRLQKGAIDPLLLGVIGGLVLMFVALLIAAALAAGPSILTYAPVSVPTSCATVLPQSTPVPPDQSPPRLCAELNNIGSAAAVCGDAAVNGGTEQGSLIAAGASKTYCVQAALSCCGVGGSTTISPVETRQ